MLDKNALINKYAKTLNGKDDGKLTTKPTLYLIRFNIYILNLNIQTYKFFKKFTQFCTFNIHIFQKIYTFLHIQPTQFYNFSKNIHSYVHSTYTFYKNVHNFVHLTNTILYIKCTQIFQKVYAILYIHQTQIFKECTQLSTLNK